jgi:galactokinase/mevalonate kinase-like predicted kinase
MITASAPGRCGLLGNPTDMYGGTVLSCSTRERARCTLSSDVDDTVITVSGQTQTIETLSDLNFRETDYLNVARAVLSALEVTPGDTPPFHLHADTEIPMQAGLAGSTAILATITGCVLAHLELRLNPYEIAELIRKIEYDLLGIVCGFQDHYMTVFGGLNYMDFRDKESAQSSEAAMPFATVEPLERYVSGLPLLLAHTGVRHHSGTVHKSIRERWLEGEDAVVSGYQEIARLTRAGKRALLSCDWPEFADLMNRNHAIQRDLGGSGESNERLIAAALAGGAEGAKLAGAGGGGTILAVSFDPEKTAQALRDAGAESIFFPHPSPGLTISIEVTAGIAH